jgi:hypothetical protein
MISNKSGWSLEMKVFLVICVCAAIASTSSGSALTWETHRKRVLVPVGGKEVSVEFSFRNTSDHHVRLKRVLPACGCTTADIPKATYAPNEAGVIKARIELGARRDLDRTLLVETEEEGNQASATLVIEIRSGPDTKAIDGSSSPSSAPASPSAD